jgi:hypothetical protein
MKDQEFMQVAIDLAKRAVEGGTKRKNSFISLSKHV